MARKSRKNLPQPEQAAVSVLLPELEEAKMPAAIYGRLSVEDEEKEESMETQIALVQDYINRSRELSYVDTYFDNGFTGTNFKRPAFTRLMNDVRQKKIKCIVVKDLSRFGRNYLEAGYYIETVFPFLGVRLIAVTDNFDSNRKEDMESLARKEWKCPHKLILLFLIFSTITIEKSQMHSSEFGGYTSSSCVF